MKSVRLDLWKSILRKQVLKTLRFFEFCNYPIDVSRRIECKKNQCEFMNDYSNAIIKVNKEGCIGYFHECRQHLPIKKYVDSLIEDYFTFVYKGKHEAEFKLLLTSRLNQRKTFFVFLNMGALHSSDSNVTRFFQENNADYLGFMSPLPEWFLSEFKPFIRYVWGALKITTIIIENQETIIFKILMLIRL